MALGKVFHLEATYGRNKKKQPRCIDLKIFFLILQPEKQKTIWRRFVKSLEKKLYQEIMFPMQIIKPKESFIPIYRTSGCFLRKKAFGLILKFLPMRCE